MRIERRGPVGKLSPRLERFFVESLGGKKLDDVQHAEARRADYGCLGGLLAIELKTLEEDGSERMDNLIDELRRRPDWPVFLGSAPIQSVLKHIDEPDQVERQLLDRAGRAIKAHMRKANKQLAAHEASFPRKNIVKVLVLANEDHTMYAPEMVAPAVQKLLLRHENGAPLYPHIDAVFFINERHATTINRQIALPILVVEGTSIENTVWKRDVTELLLVRWATWNGFPLHHADLQEQRFTCIDHIPEKMSRHESWELDYKRRPYLEDLPDDELRECFDEIICIASLAFLKASPAKPSNDDIAWSMSSMSHMMLEMGARGIPVTQFQHDATRLAAAARRIGLSAQVVAWFADGMGRDPDTETNG